MASGTPKGHKSRTEKEKLSAEMEEAREKFVDELYKNNPPDAGGAWFVAQAFEGTAEWISRFRHPYGFAITGRICGFRHPVFSFQ